jgi:DNA-binding PadR family transcriptional regulator
MQNRSDLPKRSSLGLLVLWHLIDEPMHVYRMQKLIEGQGKDRVVNVRSPASLYQTIKRLQQHGLVEVKATVRAGNQPDRTVYAITDAGREAAYRWLEQILLETGGEYPEFVAALSMVFVLSPEQVLDLLEKRASHLEDELTRAEEELAAYPELPRLFLLDEEYRSTMLRAELAWIRAVCEDIRHGRLAWDEDWMRVMAARFNPPSDEAGPP